MPLVLKGKDFSRLANERMKFSVVYFSNGKQRVLVSKEAKKFIGKQKFERELKIKISNLSGTCACPGLAKGLVRIINMPEEIFLK